MARPNPLKRKLRDGGRALGCIVSLRGADSAEILAHAGFDFLFIDHEHGAGSLGDAIDQMRAMKGTDAASLVRVPAGDRGHLQRVLDAGADGVVLPGVESAAEAEALVRACRYPPRGTRGAGMATRATLYGHDPDYSDDELLVAVQVESLAAVAQIEAIAAAPGVDAVLIGPRDLSADMGRLNQLRDPELVAKIAEARDRILAAGVFLGSALQAGRTTAEMFADGYHMVIAGSDAAILAQGARSVVAAR